MALGVVELVREGLDTKGITCAICLEDFTDAKYIGHVSRTSDGGTVTTDIFHRQCWKNYKSNFFKERRHIQFQSITCPTCKLPTIDTADNVTRAIKVALNNLTFINLGKTPFTEENPYSDIILPQFAVGVHAFTDIVLFTRTKKQLEEAFERYNKVLKAMTKNSRFSPERIVAEAMDSYRFTLITSAASDRDNDSPNSALAVAYRTYRARIAVANTSRQEFSNSLSAGSFIRSAKKIIPPSILKRHGVEEDVIKIWHVRAVAMVLFSGLAWFGWSLVSSYQISEISLEKEL